jgi:hypothetical protein
MGRLSNAPVTRPTKQRYHYLTFTMEAESEAIAETCNDHAQKGYRLHTAHFFGAGENAKVTLIFERRLRKVKRKAPAQATEIPVPPGAVS